MLNYLLTFLISLGISFILTPLVRRLSVKMKWLDRPNYRKVNKNPMPLLGGIAIYVAFISALLFFVYKTEAEFDKYKFWGLIGSSFVIFLSGIDDDLKVLTARRKLFYQVAAGLIAYISGYTIIKISAPLGGSLHAPLLIGMGLTVFWIVGFSNAVNLLDGLDGLAAGVVSIVAISLFFAALKINNVFMGVLSIGLAGSALGFLPYNFYPAKIFMGDTGSMFLGFVLSLVAIEGSYKGATFITIFVPVIAMTIPVVDTALSILRRMAKRERIFYPDKEHIHHKLLIREGSQLRAVWSLYSLTICFGLIAIAISGMKGIWAYSAIIATGVLTLRWMVNSDLLSFVRNGAK